MLLLRLHVINEPACAGAWFTRASGRFRQHKRASFYFHIAKKWTLFHKAQNCSRYNMQSWDCSLHRLQLLVYVWFHLMLRKLKQLLLVQGHMVSQATSLPQTTSRGATNWDALFWGNKVLRYVVITRKASYKIDIFCDNDKNMSHQPEKFINWEKFLVITTIFSIFLLHLFCSWLSNPLPYMFLPAPSTKKSYF